MKKKVKRDVVREIPPAEFAAKLRRLADALEQGKRFEIRVAGERVHIPARAQFSIEHERDGSSEEIEFQARWNNGN